MYQRTWPCRGVDASQPGRAHAKPWLLVEDPSPVAEVSDFSLFEQAGFEVAVCGGPDPSATCPLVEGNGCALVEAADVILFGLDLDDEAGRDVLRSHLRYHPETPVVVRVPRRPDTELPDEVARCSVIPSPASIGGQTAALVKALSASGWGGPAPR